MADGSRRNRIFSHVGAMSRVWEQTLQIGLENTIVFETRACDKMEEIRLNLKEFYAVYKGVEFKIYDACPMFTDDRKYQLKCRAGA